MEKELLKQSFTLHVFPDFIHIILNGNPRITLTLAKAIHDLFGEDLTKSFVNFQGYSQVVAPLEIVPSITNKRDAIIF